MNFPFVETFNSGFWLYCLGLMVELLDLNGGVPRIEFLGVGNNGGRVVLGDDYCVW